MQKYPTSEAWMKRLWQRKYMLLLAVLIVAGVLFPFVPHWGERARILASILAALVSLGALLVVFEKTWQRRLALLLLVVLFGSNIAHETLQLPLQMGAIIYHFIAILYVGFAVAVILKRIFHQKIIGTDDVVGAVCGYLAAAICWANAYGLVYLLWPGSFRIADTIAWQLGSWDLQRFFFNYFSLMTITTLGYDDIIPTGAFALSLSWLEAVFGQFYIAVVVAQLVGLRLAQSMRQV
jgi:hypothetical protein